MPPLVLFGPYDLKHRLPKLKHFLTVGLDRFEAKPSRYGFELFSTER